MSYVVFDIETDGIGGPMDRIGLGGPNRTFTLPWDGRTKAFTAQFLSAPGAVKVGHNLPFDEPHLRRNGVTVALPWWDTMLAGHLIEADMKKALRSMAPLYLDVRPWKHLADDQPELYNATDVAVTRALYLAQVEILQNEGMLDYFQNVVMPGVPVLINQTELGLVVDLEERERLRTGLLDYLADAHQTWGGLSNVNPKSNDSLCGLFYGHLGLPVQRSKDTGRPSVDVDALEALRLVAGEHEPLIDALLEIRRTEYLMSHYIEMPGASSGCVHASFLPGQKDNVEGGGKGAATTGRLGASPNLQNVPGDWKFKGRRVEAEEAQRLLSEGAKVLPPMRRMFVPRKRDYVFVEADYSQLQLRIIQAIAKCPDLGKALDGNLHETTRLAVERESKMPVSRVLAKNYSYLTWFGGTANGLVRFFRGRGINLTLAQATAGQRGIAKAYPRAWAQKQMWERLVETEGWLREPFGRKRHFYGRSADKTEGVVFVPQGCEGSIMWFQLPRQHTLAEAHGAYFPLSIHDGYLHEVHKDGVQEYAEMLKEVMECEYPQVAPGWSVPVDVKTGKNWGAMEKLSERERQQAA